MSNVLVISVSVLISVYFHHAKILHNLTHFTFYCRKGKSEKSIIQCVWRKCIDSTPAPKILCQSSMLKMHHVLEDQLFMTNL